MEKITAEKIKAYKSLVLNSFLDDRQPTLKKKKVGCLLLSITLNILFGLFCVVFGIFLFNNIYTHINKLPTSFCGTFSLRVSSTSLEESDLYEDDNIFVRKVVTDTLKREDVIVFYVDDNSLEKFNEVSKEVIEVNGETSYDMSISTFFSIQNKYILDAAKNGKKMVIHHIKEIYEDENGERWFVTYGSSNIDYDRGWVINENYVLGKYDKSEMASTYTFILNTIFSSSWYYVIIVGFIAILVSYILSIYIQYIKKLHLQDKLLKGEIKVYDDVCLKNNILKSLSKRELLLLIVRSKGEDNLKQLAYIYKVGLMSESIKEYVIKREIILFVDTFNKRLIEDCVRKKEEGETEDKISKYYLAEKSKIEKNIIKCLK